jgi:streptomycin 6-kinase
MGEIHFGEQSTVPIALKIFRIRGDELLGAIALDRASGHGAVRVLARDDNALLMERASPGRELAALAREGDDIAATEIFAKVAPQFEAPIGPEFPTIEDWGKGFDRYRKSGSNAIAPALVDRAQNKFFELAASQSDLRLLHGDLHHYNILFDQQRGWLAIDPKGVVGELAYEAGAYLRNPIEDGAFFADASIIRRRATQIAAAWSVDSNRIREWAFAQFILSIIWAIEDGWDFAPALDRIDAFTAAVDA